MTETEFGTFDRAFGRVVGAYRLKLKPTEAEELTRTYFRVLEPFPLEEVLLAGKRCLTKYRRFPPAADWIAELTATAAAPAAAADVRQMGAFELEEYEHATRLRYTDQPCACAECAAAGVGDRSVRFVPTLFGGVEERAFNPRRKVVQVVGHWAHGEELRRWYEARDGFFALAPAGIVRLLHQRDRRSFTARVDAIFRPLSPEREPGEEG